MLFRRVEHAVFRLTKVLTFGNFMNNEIDVKPWNLKNTKQQKQALHNRSQRPFPALAGNFHDCLTMPGLEQPDNLAFLQQELMETRDVDLSGDNVALFMYNFSKGNQMTEESWEKIEPQISRHKGEYTERAVFGGLYGSILMNKQKWIPFFLNELHVSQFGLTKFQSFEIVEALNGSTLFDLDGKHSFWDKEFKEYFMKDLQTMKMKNINDAFRLLRAFKTLEYFHDEQIWDNILRQFDNRKGWIRTDILEELHPLRSRFPEAERIFCKHYYDLIKNPVYIWRYNFDELRLFSSEEMIAKSQANIKMYPKERSLIPDWQYSKELNQQYKEWLVSGSVKVQSEVIKDKSQYLAYAIYDRFKQMKDDKVDFSMMKIDEFEDLFGTFDSEFMQNFKSSDKGKQKKKNLIKTVKAGPGNSTIQMGPAGTMITFKKSTKPRTAPKKPKITNKSKTPEKGDKGAKKQAEKTEAVEGGEEATKS